MTQRVVIGLEPGAEWSAIKTKLVAAGAESVTDPSPSQPDVLIATISSERNVEEFVQQAKKIAGVRYAEGDVWRMSY